jgi:UrcA family protein
MFRPVVLFFAAAAALAAPASAASASVIRVAAATEAVLRNGAIIVSYRDLNIKKPAGARALLARIEHAASRACGGNPMQSRYTADTAIMVREFNKCRNQAIAVSIANVGSPLLRRVYAERIGAIPVR